MDEATLTFAQVEALVGHPVPPPARTRAAWWRNVIDPHDAESCPWYGWVSVGWAAIPDMPGGTVTFRDRRVEAP